MAFKNNIRNVAIYLNTLPGDSTAGREKIKIMESFAEPLQLDPDIEAIIVRPMDTRQQRQVFMNGDRFKVYDTEFSMSFGYHFSPNPTTLRACLRKDLTAKHKKDGKIWYTDANALGCYDRNSTRVRIAYGDIYPDKAQYFNKNSPGDRWEKISKEYGITIKEYKDKVPVKQSTYKKGFIYICCNRGSSGYSAFGKNAADWSIETAKTIRKYTTRPIVIRQHKASKYPSYARDKAVLDKFATENASVYIEHKSSYLYPMSAGAYKNIENPNYVLNKYQYFCNYAYAHWSNKELRKGLYWKRVKNQILNSS